MLRRLRAAWCILGSMYEHRDKPPLSRKGILLRLVRHGFSPAALCSLRSEAGFCYHGFEGFTWIDATVNASMILGGMGSVNELHTTVGEFFASIYALFSGVVFIAVMGVLLAPFAYRLLHRFHRELGAAREGNTDEQ